MNKNKQDNQLSSIQSCFPQKSYQSLYNRPTVWTAPWCSCGSWTNRPCCPPNNNFPPHCPPHWQPWPPCPPPPCPPHWDPNPPWQPHPPIPPKPSPKPPKPNFPDNCPPDMMWLLLGYWMGSNCCNTTYSLQEVEKDI